MIRNYIKIAFRNLLRHKGFAFLNITGLAIGMAAGFLVLLYVSFELSYDTMHSKRDQIYRVVADIKTPSETINASIPAWPVAPNLEKAFPEVLKASRVMSDGFVVEIGNEKYLEENVIVADSAFLDIFDFKLLRGEKEDMLKRPHTAIITESIAAKYFGTQDPMGKEFIVERFDSPIQIIGIMDEIPENSHIQGDILLSMITYTAPPSERDTQWGNYNPSAYVLLDSSADPKVLEAKLPDFLEERSGDEMREMQMFVTLFLEPFEEVYLYSTRGGSQASGNISNVYVFAIIGIFILLIASINFINLSTARSVERAKEVGIRKVVGAGKHQLSFQFIGESIIVCFLAYILAVGITIVGLPLFNTLAGKTVSSGIFAEPMNLVYLFGIAMLIGLIAGTYPALVLSSFRPVSVLKGRFSTGSAGIILRKSLVIVQFTISIALIIGTIVIYSQLTFMQNQDLGFTKDPVVVLPTNMGDSQDALRNRISQIPSVKGTALSSSVPGIGNAAAYSEIQNQQGDFQIANLDFYFVNEDYIDQLGLNVVAGRAFSRDFVSDSSSAMVINEKTVSLLGFANPEDAIGANYKQWGSEGKVIGVVQDFNFRSLHSEISPITMRLDPTGTNLLTIKLSSDNIQQSVASIESIWKDIMPTDPFEYYFLDELFNDQYQAEESFKDLFLSFAFLAIFISCLGLLGLAAYSTMQRKREISIRKIVGASIFSIVNLLSKDFLKLVGIAFIVATPLSWLIMSSWLEDFAYKIDIKFWMFFAAGFCALIIALATISFQAISAAIANPVNAIKAD